MTSINKLIIWCSFPVVICSLGIFVLRIRMIFHSLKPFTHLSGQQIAYFENPCSDHSRGAKNVTSLTGDTFTANYHLIDSPPVNNNEGFDGVND